MKPLKTRVCVCIDTSAYLEAKANNINLSQLFNEYITIYLRKRTSHANASRVQQELEQLEKRKEALNRKMITQMLSYQEEQEKAHQRSKKANIQRNAVLASGLVGSK